MRNIKKNSKVFIILFAGILLFMFVSCKTNSTRSDAYGNFEATDIIVSSQVNGEILNLNLDEGDKIKKGQVICEIDKTPFELQINELNAKKNIIDAKIKSYNRQIDVIKAEKLILVKDRKRFKKMLKDSAASQKQVDDIEGRINVRNRQIKNVEAQISAILLEKNVIDKNIDRIKYSISKCTVTSPAAGTILEKYVEQGELAAPGKPVLKLADLVHIYLRAYIGETQLTDIKIGDEVKVFIDIKNNKMKEYKGIVSYISDEAEFTPKIIQTKEERVNLVYLIKIKIDNDGMIKIGMPGEVVFKNE